MEMISKAIVDGALQAQLEKLKQDEPTIEHRQVARALMAAGGHGQPLNRADRRALKAIARKRETQQRLERDRAAAARVRA